MGDRQDDRIPLAYSMACDALDAQVASLDELRSRVGTLLAGSSVATGFLAGQALNKSRGLPAAAVMACIAAFALMCLIAFLLWPRSWKGLNRNATAVMEDIEATPERAFDEFQLEMTRYAAAAALDNRSKLERLYKWFSFGLVCLIVDFAGWIWVLATN